MSSRQKYRFPFAKYPAVRNAILLAAGIILDKVIVFSVIWWIGFFCGTATVFFLANFFTRRSLNQFFYKLSIVSYLILLINLGGLWHNVWSSLDTNNTEQALSSFVWEQLIFRGELTNIQQTSTGKYQLDVSVDTTEFSDQLYSFESYTVRAILNPENLSLPAQMKLGDRLTFRATVYPLEEKRNPHQFDYKNYLASLDIYNQAGIDSILAVTSPPESSVWRWNKLRQGTNDLINHNFSTETNSLAKALLIGYKNELNRDEKIAFSRVGLSHIMAVSGLHVGFLLAPFWILIPMLWRFKYGRPVGLIIIVALLFFYAGLTTFSASVTRASITGGFIMYGRLFNKVRDTLNLTAVAAIIILLINPAELFEIGFQLSFGAVFTILLVMPTLNRWLPVWIRYRWTGSLIMIILVSIVVQLGLYPLLTYYFGEFSLIGPLANALVIPGLTVVVPFALFLLLVSSVLPSVGAFLNTPNEWFLQLLNKFVTHTATLEISWIQTHLNDPLVFVLWIVAILGLASFHNPAYRWKILILFLTLMTVQQSSKIIEKLKTPTLEITIFDVGQGDAALVKTPLNKHILIDAGRWTPDYNSARYVILPHLKAEGINKLDAVFLSHPHADHIGGILELINEIPIETIYNSGYEYTSELYANYIELAEEKGIPIVSLQAGELLTLDPAMPIFVYGPTAGPKGSDPNEYSLVLELIYGDTEFLFMGDAGKEQEERLITRYGNLLETDFLKVGHHGSRTSSSDAFLSTVRPDISSVSLGLDNRFKHPHPEAVERLQYSGTQSYFTSLDKALIFTSDGYKIKREAW